MGKFLLLYCILFLSSITYSQSNSPLPFIKVTDTNDREDILVDCDYPVDENRCFILKANYTPIFETTAYEVSATTYVNPILGLIGTEINQITTDDTWSDEIDLPFTFCFFNSNYDKFILGDNGLVTFDTSVATQDSQYIQSQLPNGALPKATIFGVFHDMVNANNTNGCTNNPLTPENECGQIKTYTAGVAPQRRFIVSYENMNHFNCEGVKSTSQIVLYETSNVIEVYIKEKPINCEVIVAENNPEEIAGIISRKNALVGIQDETRTTAFFPTDRNNSEWSTTNEAWRFTPNGLPVSRVVWTDETGEEIGTADEITICPEKTTTYKASITYDVCIGEPVTLSDEIDITIDTLFPVATDIDKIICDTVPFNSEEVNLLSFESELIGTQTGLLVSYHNSPNDAKLNQNPIVDSSAYELTQPTTFIYARLQRGVSCFDVGTMTLRLTKIGIPAISEIAVCDELDDDIETVTFADFNASIIGSQPQMNVSYHLTRPEAERNDNQVTQIIATNTPPTAIFVRFSIGADELCTNIEELPIRLKQKPIVKDVTDEICDHLEEYDLTSFEDEVNLANTGQNIIYTYHLFESWAESNINPLGTGDTPTEIRNSLIRYRHQRRATFFVRAQGPEGCHEVFKISLTYKRGIPVNDNELIETGTTFDLTTSIEEMIASTTNIQVEYFVCGTDPIELLTVDPTTFELTDSTGEEQVCVQFTNPEGCINSGTINLISTGGAGGGGGGGFASCDFGNDGTETFTLSDFVPEIISRVTYRTPELLVVSFHKDEPDAIADVNEILEETISADKTLTIRLTALRDKTAPRNEPGNEVEFWTDTFTLEFKPATLFDEVNDGICDVRSDNRENIDLTSYETEILDGKLGTFAYFDSRDNEITDPTRYPFIGPSKEIKVIVTTPDGCDNETKITLTFDPPIPANRAILNICDVGADNTETINLNDALPQINADFINFTASYYSRISTPRGDPDLGLNPIIAPESYEFKNRIEFIDVRLEDRDGCYTTTNIRVNRVVVPIVAKSVLDICDFNNDNEELEVDLTSYTNTIRGANRSIIVTYYENEPDAIANENSITESDVRPTTTLYANLISGSICVTRTALTFNFRPTPVVANHKVEVCDNEIDGIEIYDLTENERFLVPDPTNKTINYYTGPENTPGQLIRNATLYEVRTSPLKIYVRATDNTSKCYSVAELDIEFIQPVQVNDVTLKTCDVSADGSEIFDVTEAIPDMVTTPTDFDISYYRNRNDAAKGDPALAIDDPSNVDTVRISSVFVRFYVMATGCYSIGRINLELLKTPKLVSNEFEICDTDLDGIFTLNLNEINSAMILNTTDLVFTYYKSFAEANDINSTNGIITDPDSYTVEDSPERVYARVVALNECFSVSFVDIIINKKVSVLPVTDDLEVCDDDRDEFELFDLTSFESKFTTEAGATFRYYNSKVDADNETNEIVDPTSYKNATKLEHEVFVRVSLVDKCDDVTSFKVKAIKFNPNLKDVTFCDRDSVELDAGPNYKSYLWSTGEITQKISVSTEATYSVTLVDQKDCIGTFDIKAKKLELPIVSTAELVECDDDGTKDGLIAFDLTSAIAKLTNGSTEVTTHFYRSPEDLEADRDEIVTTTSFRNTINPQTLSVKVENKETFCFETTTLKLTGSFIEASIALIEVCDELNSEDGISNFDLTEADSQVLEGLTITQVAYYVSQQDANLKQNQLATNYTNTTAYEQIIYARVENVDECEDIVAVTLQVNKLPNINTEEEVVYCENFFPETIVLTSGIPVSETTDYTYLWDTGETTSTIDINKAGTYTVVVTSLKKCKKTKVITVPSLTVEAFNDEILQCDDEIVDEKTSFDLTSAIEKVTGGNTEVLVRFYEERQEAIDDVNVLNALAYTNRSNPQIIYAKVIHNDTFCYEISEVTLQVSAIVPNMASLEICDEIISEDGIGIFDLNLATPQVIEGLPISEVRYFNTFNDAKLNKNSLGAIYENEVSYNQTIFSRIVNSDGCVGIGEVKLIINRLPNLEADEEVIYCINTFPETITLTSGLLDRNTNQYTYLWNTGESTSTININEIGEYAVMVTDGKDCFKERKITVIPSEKAIIELIDIGDKSQINTITVSIKGIGDYEYSIDGINYQDSNFFENVSGGITDVYVQDKNGCGITRDKISVLVIPNFITPNGDGFNDTWMPIGISSEFQQNMEIHIFDRYGKLITRVDPKGNGWDGNYNNAKLPTTDYWYSISYIEVFSGKRRQFKGHFSLKR